jgi:hypothetical protein
MAHAPFFFTASARLVFFMVKGIISAGKVQEEIASCKSFPIDSGIVSDRISRIYRINP